MRSHVLGIAFIVIVLGLIGYVPDRAPYEAHAAEPAIAADERFTAANCEEGIEVECKKMQSIFIPDNPVYAAYILKIQSNQDLICLERSEPVFTAFLSRHGIHSKYRRQALSALAKLRKTDTATEWVKAVQEIDEKGITLEPAEGGDVKPTEAQTAWVLTHFTKLLTDCDARQLVAKRDIFEALAANSKRAAVRTAGYVALASADNNAAAAWQHASRHRLVDLLRGVRYISQPDIRTGLYKNILSVIDNPGDAAAQEAAVSALAHVPGHDADVFAKLAKLIAEGVQRQAAINALLHTDAANWPSDAVEPLANDVVDYLAAIPADARTGSTGKQAMALVRDLAAVLPADNASGLRRKLGALRVTTIRIQTILEEMSYDQDVVVVPAGRPVEILFTNSDAMPHNLVIAQPGAMEEIGMASDEMATQPDAAARHYVPPSRKVLHHTKMLNGDQTQRLFFTAPAKPDVYPILCTFPGHWLKMYSAMVVVDDVDAYLAANDPLPAKDALLSIVTYEHNFDELAKQIAEVDTGRSFARGQAAFKMRSCVSCHTIQGKGGRVGPDLTVIAEQNKPLDVLRSIMVPSEKIDPKFANVEIEDLDSGKIHSGVIVPQDDESLVYLVKDPLADCEPQVFQRDDIEIVPLKTSPMPTELLKRSSPDEVWDLIAYMMSGGNPEHPLYSGSGGSNE